MNDSEILAFVRRVLAVYDGFDGPDGSELWWRVDGEYAPVTMFAMCNDLFYWGSADLEKITPENVAELERAVEDCKKVDDVVGVCDATSLFCCRVRKMRPQGAAYPKDPKFWPLFDECGPEREVGLGNPRKHPKEENEPVVTEEVVA